MKGSWSLFAALLFILVFVATKLQYEHFKIERRWDYYLGRRRAGSSLLPRGIVQSTSDLQLRPLWTSSRPSFLQDDAREKSSALLAVPVGLKQKRNVDTMVKKFLSVNSSILLFHYDGNVDAWNDLDWSNKAIHILAQNQTKWWFAKRFLHPDVVYIYDYIFLWDEDLGVDNFHPGRFLQTMISEGLEIAQPALDPDLSEVHHRITIRNKKEKVHRWIEGMAPVFSREAWRCVWHLIQNDLIHGWGLDMKIGYCAQGDRTEKVGVIDSEYIVHHGVPSLGGVSGNKAPSDRSLDLRTHIRRQSMAELEVFRQRWDQAVREDEGWADPFDDFK
ncbi:hypothetical protein IFM89_039586 [Coptis chinensis]|uniref:Lysine ketoglutarate reductase trans-splicing-like protein n=1 Tax=Coptis chinensis TaxID=261450 RepID=A0A835LC87_9MAGN|nr:hypothetical protein IFM89_039586 [Coptis chinensis]